MKKCYLITGGNGNLARQLAEILIPMGHKVVLFDISAPQILLKGADYVEGDITDTAMLHGIFELYMPTHVLHMASLLSGSSESDRLKAWAVNATASFELLELSMQYKAEKFFFPSTVVTYGGQLINPLPEDFPQWPVSIYGATKVAVERMGSYYHSKFGLDFRALRLPFVISGFAPSGALTAYASHVFNEAVNGKDFEFPVNENTAVSTIYVKDVIKGILQLLDAPDEKLTRRVYNVHAFSPAALPIGQAIKKHLPDFNFTFSPDENVLRITGAMPEVMDDHSAREDWGWDPQYDLDKMTKDFIDALHHKK